MNRDWVDKDFYEVLGVESTADQDAIKRAYRKLAQQYHPDANPDDPSAEDRFKDISEAYATLSDSDQRREYDEVRRMVANGGFSGFGAPGGFGPFGAGSQRIRVEDLSDLLGGFGFGNLFGGARQGPARGADVATDLHLSFEDSVRGVTTTIPVRGETDCHRCHGNGAEPRTSVSLCPSCGGAGTIPQNQGLFSFAQPCRECRGRGQVIEKPCSNCAGSGREVRSRNITVKIPAGVHNGSTVRLRGKGAPGTGGGPPGDLLVRTIVAPHPIFGRRGDHITITVPISFTEATLGSQIAVPTLDGPVKLKIPSGTESGKTFRVRGRGVKKSKGKPGDFMVTVDVAVPTKLPRAAKKLLEQFRDEYETDDLRAHLKV